MLETRLALSTAVAVVLESATTADSKGVTVHYDVTAPLGAGQPLSFGVYRSADDQFGADDVAVGPGPIAAPALDDARRPSTAVGDHMMTIPLPGGLPLNPEHPDVVVVADPNEPGATDPGRSSAFRVVTIGVLVHGGGQASSADDHGPGWEVRAAGALRAEGYDFVIPFVWASQSWTPGAASKEVPRLASTIDRAAALFPAGDVVDLHLIAHSEGTVIASRALQHLDPTPGLAKGYVELTLLDPYPSTNAPKRTQYSDVGGLVGYLAARGMATYQGWAHDPAPYIAPIVDDAEVYYQHTPVGMAKTGLIAFWGLSHVDAAPGVPVHYVDLTGPGISHSGDFSVRDWYWANVLPHLGDGPAFQDPGALTASPPASAPAGVTLSGTSAPDATVEVFAVPPGTHSRVGIGRTFADASGLWSLTAAPTAGRVFARSAVPAFPGALRTYVMHTVRVPSATPGVSP